MSLIKSKEGGTVHRGGYQPNLARIRIRILRFLNTSILKYSKYSNSKELKWTEGGVGCQPKLKCYQGLSPLRPVHLKILSWERLNWPETRSNHFFCPSSGIKGENQKWKKFTGASGPELVCNSTFNFQGQNWFAIQLSTFGARIGLQFNFQANVISWIRLSMAVLE